MQRALVGLCLVTLVTSVSGAEREIDFTKTRLNEQPAGFRSTVTGAGKPGEWKVILDEVPSLLAPLNPASTPVPKRSVLAQLSRDSTDEHFPLLVADEEVYADFTLKARFKTVAGSIEQMAGVAFRIKDENNYYVVRASSLGNNLRFYKFVEGVRSAPIGPEVPIPSGVWHELAVQCKGNEIHCQLDGKEIIPPLNDTSFSEGKIGFWTKSDSVSYFTDVHLDYTPAEMLATVLVHEMIQKYPRLIGLRLYAKTVKRPELHVVAAKPEGDISLPAGRVEQDVVARGVVYFGKEKKQKSVLVTMPLRDRNGEVVAAVRFSLESFPGQTEQNAVGRAMPMLREMEARVRTAKDLTN